VRIEEDAPWERVKRTDVTAIAVEVAGLESLSDVLLNDDGAAGGVDEVSA
jgi:hypothetical protein